MTASMTAPTVPDGAALAEAVAGLRDLAAGLVDGGTAAQLRDEDIADLLLTAARLLTAKADRTGVRPHWPVARDALTATETVTLVTALLEAADINLFDLAIWYRRQG